MILYTIIVDTFPKNLLWLKIRNLEIYAFDLNIKT